MHTRNKNKARCWNGTHFTEFSPWIHFLAIFLPLIFGITSHIWLILWAFAIFSSHQITRTSCLHCIKYFIKMYFETLRAKTKKCLWSPATDKIINEDVIAISTELYYGCRLKRVKICYQVMQKKKPALPFKSVFMTFANCSWPQTMTLILNNNAQYYKALNHRWSMLNMALATEEEKISLRSCSALDVVIVFMPNTVACSCFCQKTLVFECVSFFLLCNVCK